MIHYLRHRLASGGSLYNAWDYDPADRAVLASFQLASAPPVHVVIPVRSIRTHERHRYIISQLSEDRWQIESAQFDPALPRMFAILLSTPEPIGALLRAL